MPVVRSATAPQNLHAEFPVQASHGLAESFRRFRHEMDAVVQFFRIERRRIGQESDDAIPNA